MSTVETGADFQGLAIVYPDLLDIGEHAGRISSRHVIHLQGGDCTFPAIIRHVHCSASSWYIVTGVKMYTFIKVIVIAVFGGLLYLVARFTDEYFRPYQRKD